MNKKGIYTPIVAAIAVILIAGAVFVQSTATKTKQSGTYERAIFDLKWGMQNMQYLLDKAAADAMADAAYAGCSVPANFSTIVKTYFDTIIGNSLARFGIACDRIIVPATVSSGVEFNFNLKCTKAISRDFKVERTTNIRLKKQVTAVVGPPCAVTVMDQQGNYNDI